MSNPVISVKNVTKAVDARRVLVDVSFDVEEQSLVSLIGPNGAGKSTLVKIILGLDPHYEGTVTIRPGERVQYIPQLATSDQYQLPLSVYEYIAIGTTPLYSGSKKPADLPKALEHVGVATNKLHQPYISLSGGERQRIAIARALLGDPTVLILDEPLAAVDYTSRNGLYELIRHLQQDHQMTVLLVSHDVESVLPLSDRVLYLNQTLHTDCHPSAFDGIQPHTIHHHC
ncbi:metal ABC transporter ATP-binding protein [Candidatus Kaiserbacteria bacterium]|nr:metal ABC transporter ATP-binding protein [Candidatus Kaiserbacteria bacterium]MCB9812472.1 metal ABC transporter ATP-binding protein [Candidatus Nomurabacteria bacterium]